MNDRAGKEQKREEPDSGGPRLGEQKPHDVQILGKSAGKEPEDNQFNEDNNQHHTPCSIPYFSFFHKSILTKVCILAIVSG